MAEFDRVGEQVEQDLADQPLVDQAAHALVDNVQAKMDVACEGAGTAHAHRVFGAAQNIRVLLAQRKLAGFGLRQIENVVDDVK